MKIRELEESLDYTKEGDASAEELGKILIENLYLRESIYGGRAGFAKLYETGAGRQNSKGLARFVVRILREFSESRV